MLFFLIGVTFYTLFQTLGKLTWQATRKLGKRLGQLSGQ